MKRNESNFHVGYTIKINSAKSPDPCKMWKSDSEPPRGSLNSLFWNYILLGGMEFIFFWHILCERWAHSISENMKLMNSVWGFSFDQCAFSIAQISNLWLLFEQLLGISATALLNSHSLHFYENKSAEKLRKFMLGWTQGRKMHKIHDKS